MNNEIKAYDNIIYWVIDNNSIYKDGSTDPNLVTTIGNGWNIYWTGSDYNEYLLICNNINMSPRILDITLPIQLIDIF